MGIVDLPRGVSKRKPALTVAEQETFLAVIAECGDQLSWDRWAWHYECGMRHDGEGDSFTIDNIDFGRKTIVFWRPKTKCWSIEMPLTSRMLEIALRRRKEAQLRPDRKVFPSTAGSRKNNWDKYMRMCNFDKHFTPYTTRHTFITRLAEEDVNPKVVMELAGHSCIETTLTYYTKSSSKILANAMIKLENARAVDSNSDSIVDENEANSLIGHNSKKALK
jgi:integrase